MKTDLTAHSKSSVSLAASHKSAGRTVWFDDSHLPINFGHIHSNFFAPESSRKRTSEDYDLVVKDGIRNVIHEMLDLRKRYKLDDAAFSEALASMLSMYIEHEVASKLNRTLQDRISSLFEIALKK